jgi:hypothetical protein
MVFVPGGSWADDWCGCSAKDQKDKTTEVKGEKGKLSLIAPNDASVKQNDSTTVTVKIKREKFDDPVDIKFDDLSKDVHVDGGEKITINKSSDEAKVTLKAD